MNVFQAQQGLIKFFQEHDSFNMDKDFLAVVIVTDKEQEDKAAVLAALSSLKEKGLITNSVISAKEYWILNKPLDSYSQHVELNFGTIQAVAAMVNGFCEETEDNKNKVNLAEGIKEADIQNLVMICSLQGKRLAELTQELEKFKEE